MNRSIPNYELYGELLAGSYSDPVHHETIRERSSKHDWTIRLHRHEGLAQVFLFQTSGVFVRMGDLEHTSTEPLILMVPPRVPHGFRFSEDVVGDVLSLRLKEIGAETATRIQQFSSSSGGVLPRSRSEHFQRVEELFRQLGDVYHGLGRERGPLLVSLTDVIVTYLSADLLLDRADGSLNALPERTRHELQAEQYCNLVETNFQSSRSIADYALEVGVSAPHLTRVCRRILGQAPNALIRQRRLLEAKRLLEYTKLSISEVAHRSGFRDPAFFSRTFKKEVGISPQSYRLQSD